MKKNSKKIVTTKEWENASYRFEDLYAELRVPEPLRIGPAPKEDEIIEELKDILSECPEFYPALLDLGLRTLHISQSDAEDRIKEGFNVMLQLQLKENRDEQFEIFIDNLEKKWRFDLSAYYLLKLIKKFPDNAEYYDWYAYTVAYSGKINEAIKYQKISLEKDPANHNFVANLGWLYILINDYDKAEKYLKNAVKINSSNNIAKRNIEINNYLRKNNFTFYDFLLEKPDYKKIYNFDAENDDWAEHEKLLATENHKKLDALKYHIVSQTNIDYVAYALSIATLKPFFQFVSSITQEIFLYDNIDFVKENFKGIMHKFIFKHADVDLQTLNEIFNGLNYYYGFLSEKKLIKKNVFDNFSKYILSLKTELIKKMNRYNEIRHNYQYDDEQKEEIREELFEGDHSWPFL